MLWTCTDPRKITWVHLQTKVSGINKENKSAAGRADESGISVSPCFLSLGRKTTIQPTYTCHIRLPVWPPVSLHPALSSSVMSPCPISGSNWGIVGWTRSCLKETAYRGFTICRAGFWKCELWRWQPPKIGHSICVSVPVSPLTFFLHLTLTEKYGSTATVRCMTDCRAPEIAKDNLSVEHETK